MTKPDKTTESPQSEKVPEAGFDARVSRDPAPIAIAQGDVSTSDEAMTVLREQGVAAWEKWVADHKKEDAVTASALADQPTDDTLEPGEGGDPAEPQKCQYGEQPAVRSLLFRDGDAYVPVCDKHDDEARQALVDAGEKVSDVVDIPADAVTAAGEAPEIVGPEVGGEIPLRFPVLVIEGADTSDGRLLEAGSLTHRALPIPLLALPESAHGGNDPGAAGIVGRIDTLTRTPGPEVTSPSTGEPFPEGTFVWSGTGVLSSTAKVGAFDVADLFRRRFLRGISVDLAGMDYEVIGEGGMAADPEFPRRQMIAHAAQISAATLVAIPAFADAYAEVADDNRLTGPHSQEELLVEGLAASAFPAWRSAEVGDYPALVASAGDGLTVVMPADAVDQLAAVIADDGGEQRDASALAVALVAHIKRAWPSGDTSDDAPTEEEGSMAAADTPLADEPGPMPDDLPTETGMPDEPQPCELDPTDPATHSLLFADGERFVAVCDTHDQEARDAIEAEGGTVSGEVLIGSDDTIPEETP